jgi:hypothetical protein
MALLRVTPFGPADAGAGHGVPSLGAAVRVTTASSDMITHEPPVGHVKENGHTIAVLRIAPDIAILRIAPRPGAVPLLP